MTKPILPSLTSRAAYHQCFRDEQVWRPAIAAICQRHHLSSETLVRAPQGSHVVFFAGDQLVIKLFSPLFHSDYEAESVALRLLANRLPVRTPDIAFEGELEGWPYLIMQRLVGELLVDCIHTMTPRERLGIAAQVGELAATLHGIPVDGASSLRSAWGAFLRQQQAQLTKKHAGSGLSPEWVDEIAATPWWARMNTSLPLWLRFSFLAPKKPCPNFFDAYGYRRDDLTPSLRARLTGYVLLHRYGPLPLYLPRFPEPRPQSIGELHELLWGF